MTSTCRTAAISAVLLVIIGRLLGAEDFADELPRIPPRSPEQGRKSIEVLPGYRVELTAAEPLVVDPVAMCFDADGAAYVIEMRDYSEQDRAMLGRVRKLVDREGDGTFDDATVFAEGLSWPTAITCWDGGVFVAAPPHMYYLKDVDGDGRVDPENAEEQRLIYTGFSRSNVQGMTNSLRWGLDCRIHGATSTAGAKLTRPDDPDFGPVDLRGRDFSFDPRNPSDLRPESGGGQHGMCFDDWGRKFVSSNSDHLQAVLYDDRYAARNPYLKAPPARVSIAADGGQAPVFRRSPVEPWRIVRTRLRVAGTVRGPVEGGGKPAGYFTGATGVTIYRGDLMPELKGQAFVADVGSNLIHRKRITPRGVGFVGTRIDEGREFLASTDIWFRPVQMANGPDGALHVLDMSREVIEHPKSLPPEIKQHLDLTSGRDRGRLYRIVPDRKIEPRPVKLSTASDEELVGLLRHQNAWHRETASRLLAERPELSERADAMLRWWTVDTRWPSLAIAHILHILRARGELGSWTIRSALEDPARGELCGQALRLAERADDKIPIANAILTSRARFSGHRVGDVNPRTQLQLAFTAGSLPPETRTTILVRVLRRPDVDPLLRFAAFSSLSTNSADVFRALMSDEEFTRTEAGPKTLGELAEVIGRRANRDEVTHVVDAISRAKDREVAGELTRRLATALAASKSPLAKELAGGDLEEVLQSMLAEARAGAGGDGASAVRLASIRTLALGTPDDAKRLLALLDVTEPEAVQRAALDALARHDEPNVGKALIERFPGLPPGVRRATFDVLLSRPTWRTAFLDAAEGGTFTRADIEVNRLRVLRATVDDVTARRIDSLIAKHGPGERADVIETYRRALELDGDVGRGRDVFRKTCATCHRVEEHGHAIGPNLATIRNRGDKAILVNVLDPNREVNPQFLEYVAVTKDGRQHTGMLASQSATTLVLKRAEGKETTLLRADVEILKSSGRSLMPEGIEKNVSVEAMADLLAYLRSLR